MATMHEILVRTSAREILGPLTRWEDADFRLRFNAPGSGTIVVHTDEPHLDALQSGGGFLLVRNDGVNQTVLLSGSVVAQREDVDAIAFEVVDDTTILADTLALPDPAGPPFDAQEYDTRTDLASTIIWEYVNENAGPGARVDRRWPGTGTPGLAMATDPGIGDAITGRARFQPLDELLRELALAGGGLRFSCAQALGSTDVVFTIEAPTDRSGTVRFSRDIGSLGPYTRTTEAGGPNYVFAGAGDALGADRTIYELGDSAAITAYGRRETFLDTRGETSASEVYQRIAETLALSGEQQALTVEPSEYVPFVYGLDYLLGDLVRVDLGDETITAIVREVTLSIDAEGGLSASPVIGTPGSSSDDAESRQIASVERRLSNIERNFNIPDDSITPEMLVGWARWNVGDYRETTRSSAATRWLLCDGSAVSRTTYAALFAVIGTTYGAGNGTTTFNLPDRRGKYSRGAGAGGVDLGESGGASSVTLTVPAHSHTGNTLAYAHTHNSQAHTHPGSHSHGMAHTHTVDIDHDHASFSSGGVNVDTVAVGSAAYGSGTTDHHHTVDVPALGTTSKTTSASSASDTGTDSDTGTFAASYSGSPNGVNGGASWTGATSQEPATDLSFNLEPTFIGVTYEIYTGV